ncbi:MAG: protein kinase [Sandaracinaceae bacterium]|nr:protein kinase [Sandaracinaceae bacterium]
MSDPIGDWADEVRGRLVGGKYRLGPLIGRGGMGAVFRAQDLALGRAIAIKLIHPQRRDSSARIERFRREARAAALVGGDGVVAVLDFDFDAELGPYQVLELLEGESLEARLERGPLPPAEAVALALGVATTLARVHREGIVHRDIKPANVFLEHADGGPAVVKLLDFGVARMRAPEELTVPGAALGTPGFMAPEQLRGVPVDARADLYALGMLLHTCVWGRPPFDGLERAEVAVRTLDGSLPSLRSLAPQLPEPILACVEAATALDPDRRPADASAFARLLGGTVAAPISVPAPARVDDDAPLASTLLSDDVAPAPRSIPDTGDPDPDRARPAPTSRSGPPPVAAPIRATLDGASQPAAERPPPYGVAVVLVVGVLAGGGLSAGVWYATRSPAPTAAPPVAPAPVSAPAAIADASVAPDTSDLRATIARAEAHLRGGGYHEAIEAFTSAHDAAWALPPGLERRGLVTRIQIGLGDAHRGQLEQAGRAARGAQCVERIASHQTAAGGAYRELHALADEDASQNAELHAGALFEAIGELCGSTEPLIRRAYLDHARIAFVDADRPGPLQEQARAAIRRVDQARQR